MGGHFSWLPSFMGAKGVGSALSFPVSFSSNSKKRSPIGVPGISIRSVPTLTGEGINTHTQNLASLCEGNIYGGYNVFATDVYNFDLS